MFKYLGLLLVFISWVAGIYMVRKWRGGYQLPISQHAASAKGAMRLFTTVLGSGIILFYWWLIKWLAPHLGLGSVFIAILFITGITQTAAALIPDVTGWRHQIHQAVASIMAACYIPLTYIMLTSSKLSATARVVIYFFIADTVIAALVFFFVRKSRNYYLIFESLYIIAFQIIILSAAYL